MQGLGEYLRNEREARGVSVAELAQTTRIPVRLLRHLERDEYEELPADVFVRGFLAAYSRALDLDERHVLSRYAGRRSSEPPASLPVVYAPEPGRRFGIAIALVALLILFTLALSIVLRPRHRDAPIELSSSEQRSRAMLHAWADEPSTQTPSSCAASITVSPTASSRS